MHALMACYAIGDIQGCVEPLERLLLRMGFDSARDELWCLGDLVNRGPASLETLRLLKQMGAQSVLGNHDVYAIARAYGIVQTNPDDTLEALLEAEDKDVLVQWLLERPVMAQVAGHTLVHAGLLPCWSIEDALAEARIAEEYLRNDPKGFLTRYFHNKRGPWQPTLTGIERAISALATLTRVRFVDAQGRMVKGSSPPELPPQPGTRPWFQARTWEQPIAFGHWAALGLWVNSKVVALDSGCVWGHNLTGCNLETHDIYAVAASTEG